MIFNPEKLNLSGIYANNLNVIPGERFPVTGLLNLIFCLQVVCYVLLKNTN